MAFSRYIVLFMLFFLGCKNNTKNNLEGIKHKNGLKVSKTTYGFKTDSLGKIIDTISIEKKKLNKNEVVVYREKKVYYDNGFLKTTNSYSDEGNLIYSKSESSELGTISSLENTENNKKITKGLYFGYKDGKVRDTIYIDYEYFFENRVKTKTIIISKFSDENEVGNLTEQLYNDGNITSEVSIQYGDTIFVTNYRYLDEKIKYKTILNYSTQLFTRYSYDVNGFPSKEEIFRGKEVATSKLSEIFYITNENGQINSSIKTDVLSNSKIYIRYKTIIAPR